MNIFGLDVTSRPRLRKPITCAVCDFAGNHLRLNEVKLFPTFEQFEAFLQTPGPWVAGVDFPFGQPRKLIQNLGWPADWEAYVDHVSRMMPQEFQIALRTYWRPRPPGDKFHFRRADQIARACSPMMLDYTPVGRMFHALAPILLRSGVSVIPCRPNRSNRIAVEAYPGVLARKFIETSYKSDTRKKQTEARRQAREQLVAAVESPRLAYAYGFTCSCGSMQQALVMDATGDTLDALLCAIQAAWAFTMRDRDYGMPEDCDPAEGCIADPACR